MDLSCLDLALEAQLSCKLGNYRRGVSFFESAMQVGTEDLQLLSAIYSQIGYAYFQLGEHNKALEYYDYDLRLARTIGDKAGEAKACGNLGHALKSVGRCDEAVPFCQRYLDITRAMSDKVGQAQALYIFGNVYHAKAMEMSWSGVEPGHFTAEATAALKKAVQYYEVNLCLVEELGDRAAEGHAYGKLGHTYHLLGDFERAVAAHEKRLLIAQEFGDRPAARRTHGNLGSTYIYLGQYEKAIFHYKRTLVLTRLLNERALEAQVNYSIGNTYTLLQDFGKAIDYYQKHLAIARELNDRVGEARVCWTLANLYTTMSNYEHAINYTRKHLEIALEMGDRNGAATARMNLLDLQQVLRLKSNTTATSLEEQSVQSPSSIQSSPEAQKDSPRPQKKQSEDSPSPPLRSKKHDEEKRDAESPVQPEEPEHATESTDPEPDVLASPEPGSLDTIGEDTFLDFLSRFQSHRMDDQRCTLDGQTNFLTSTPSYTPPVAERKSIPGLTTPSQDPGHFLELLASSQARRLNDQRVSLSHFPGLRPSTSSQPRTPSTSSTDQVPSQATTAGSPQTPSQCVRHEASTEPSEDSVFHSMVEKSQGSSWSGESFALPTRKAQTLPDEDFYNFIVSLQSRRMEEQRVPPPPAITPTEPDEKHGV
ncbi:G-protein-signaling modulator 2-like isoform X2 [Salarias fasciatus]|uniref:G-protein-signaling modulator 2-like n=2 Tax=Salarias fasciatus TaxID=181472 RepID=A0A672HM16_SALFA|nr:G-protein-signaling modulator 2-like isoform X2 [Salarias fasciatus]XP_029939868.1 G-protein-signaling modulator 2-like isoform X2 [Salarias fasciatus]